VWAGWCPIGKVCAVGIIPSGPWRTTAPPYVTDSRRHSADYKGFHPGDRPTDCGRTGPRLIRTVTRAVMRDRPGRAHWRPQADPLPLADTAARTSAPSHYTRYSEPADPLPRAHLSFHPRRSATERLGHRSDDLTQTPLALTAVAVSAVLVFVHSYGANWRIGRSEGMCHPETQSCVSMLHSTLWSWSTRGRPDVGAINTLICNAGGPTTCVVTAAKPAGDARPSSRPDYTKTVLDSAVAVVVLPPSKAIAGGVQPRGPDGFELPCLVCGALFIALRVDRRTCSLACARHDRADGAAAGRTDKRFCSSRCRVRAHRRRRRRTPIEDYVAVPADRQVRT
jgi:predicted nucleic acid-binding Zn ribbon protein